MAHKVGFSQEKLIILNLKITFLNNSHLLTKPYSMRHYILILFITISLLSCGQNDTKQKELELKERELALKEKELELKDKVSNTSMTDTANSKEVSSQIEVDQNVPTAKVPLTKAADIRKIHPACNESNTPHTEGFAPLVDMYCGVLGQKPIEIYITSQNESNKTVKGYSVVGNSKTSFEGRYIAKVHKGTGKNDDYDNTIYSLILREPVTSNKNGVFSLKLFISDQTRDGDGTWTSYDGMLYRGINIYDRLNADF